MKVYVLLEYIRPDGCTIVGVYSTYELASNKFEELRNLNIKDRDVSYEISEEEVKNSNV